MSIVASSAQVYACDSGGYNGNIAPWDNRPHNDNDSNNSDNNNNNSNNNDQNGNNDQNNNSNDETKPSRSEQRDYDTISQYKSETVYVRNIRIKSDIEKFISKALSVENNNENSNFKVQVFEQKKTFVVKFGSSKLRLEIKYELRKNVIDYIKNDLKLKMIDFDTLDLETLDVGRDYSKLYKKLKEELKFPEMISESWFNKDSDFDKDYNYMNKILFNFDDIYANYDQDRSNWFEYYKNKFEGKLNVKFLPEKRIDILVDKDLSMTQRNLKSSDIYNHYVNKTNFKENYSRYKIEKNGFVVDSSYYDLKVTYKNDFLGDFATNRDNSYLIDLSRDISKVIDNNTGIYENNVAVWRKNIIEEVKAKSKDSTEEILNNLDININEAKRTFSVDVKKSALGPFCKYENRVEGKLIGPLSAKNYIKNTYLGLMEKNTVYQNETVSKPNIARYISSLNGYKITENDITINNEKTIFQDHKLDIDFKLSRYTSDKDYLVGKIIFTFDWYDKNANSKNDKYLKLERNSNLYYKKTIMLDRKNNDMLIILDNADSLFALKIYRQTTQKYVDIDLYKKIGIDDLEINNIFKLDTNLLLVSTNKGIYKVSLSFEDNIKDCTVLDINGIKDKIDTFYMNSVKMVNDKMVIDIGGLLYLFENYKYKATISPQTINKNVESYELVGSKLVYYCKDNTVYYVDLQANVTSEIKINENSINNKNFKIEFLIKEDNIYIFTNNYQVPNRKLWALYKYDIKSKNLSSRLEMVEFSANNNINSIEYDNKGNILLFVQSSLSTQVRTIKRVVTLRENDIKKDLANKARYIFNSNYWMFEGDKNQDVLDYHLVDSYGELIDGVYIVKQCFVLEYTNDTIIYWVEYAFNEKS
ncbi:hypothetical protein SHELI_v1c08380 [Spiroplasma helicoides]|uniref:Uncharacterized protein n=2 Tax=Spiroplasma helicoides TaxID=216938 RepID=A0A1B3SLI4_9MOLU|nr:hypothetical protein SHELI_v1c08380 [Spiroplasma helicoides]